MKLPVKSDYATRAIAALSRRYASGHPHRIEDMARENGIPPKFLVQILLELKSAGFVKSIRGQQGGYLLARAPSEITFGDILKCMHGELFESPALADPTCPTEPQRTWKHLQSALAQAAAKISFQQLLEEHAAREKMYYI